jgi:hypothetical protein
MGMIASVRWGSLGLELSFNYSSSSSETSGYIRTFLRRLHAQKSLEKCGCDEKKTAVRTQSGHFSSGKLHGLLGVGAPLKLYPEAHDQAHHVAYDEAYDRTDDGVDAIAKIHSLTRQTEN